MRRFSLVTIWFLGLLLVECSAPSAGTIDLDELAFPSNVQIFCSPDTTPQEEALAVAWWGMAIDFDCRSGSFPIVAEDIEGRWVGGRLYADHIALDPIAWEKGLVDIVVAHEIGHKLGFDHDEHPCSVMHRSTTSMDIECVRRAYAE
jgi:hypothetical protein